MSAPRGVSSPRDFPVGTAADLMVLVCTEARLRLFTAACREHPPDPLDVLTALAAAEAAAAALRGSRWCYVRDGLTLGLTVRQLATALDIEPAELVAGYESWVAGQRWLYTSHQPTVLGMTPAESEAALALLGPADELPAAAGGPLRAVPSRRR